MTPSQALALAEAMNTVHEAMSEFEKKSPEGTLLFIRWTQAMVDMALIAKDILAGKTLEEAVQIAIAD